MFTFFAVQFFRFTFVSASNGHTLPFAIAQPENIARQKSVKKQQDEAGTRRSHPPSTWMAEKNVRRPHHRIRQKIRQHRPTAKRCPSAAPPKPAENSARTSRPQKGVRRPPHRDRQKIRHAPAGRKKVSAPPTHFTTIPPTISPTSHPNERPRTENHGAFPSHPDAICQRTRRGSRHHLQHL